MSDNVSLSHPEIIRRQILRTVGSLTLLGGATIGTSTTAVADRGTPKWIFKTDYGISSSPTVVDGTIFIGSGRVDREGRLYAVDAETGDEEWAFKTENRVGSPPTVVGRTVFVGSDSNLYAVNAETGEEEWIFETDGYIDSSPTVVDRTVFVGSDSNLHAINAETGEEEWIFETNGDVLSPTVVDGTVFISSNDHKLHAVDAEAGVKKWEFEPNAVSQDDSPFSFAMSSSPTVANETVFVRSDNRYLYAVDIETGTREWAFEVGEDSFSPTVADGSVIVSNNNYNTGSGGFLYAVDSETGDEEWVFKNNEFFASSPTVVNETVFIGSQENKLFSVDATTGDTQWYFETDGTVLSPTVVVDGIIFIRNSNNNLSAVDTGLTGSSEGSRTWLGTLSHHGTWKYANQIIKSFTVDLEDPKIKAGSSKSIDIRVTNNRKESLRNIKGKLLVEDPFSSFKNEVSIEALDSNETTTVTIDVSAADGATNKAYPVSMDFQYTNPDGKTKLTGSYRMMVTIVPSKTNPDGLSFSGFVEENRTPILLGASGTVVAGIYLWRSSQSSDSPANNINSDTDTTTESIAESTAEDTTVEPSKLQEQATESIERAERAAEYADYEMSRDSYEEAIALLKKAAATADPDMEADINTKVEETQTALKTTTACQEQRDSLASTLQAAERSFKEAIARYAAGNQTVARIRFRQARDTFEEAKQAIGDTDVEVLTQPIEVSFEAEATIQSTALEDLGLLDDSTLDTLSATGIESISELEVNTDQLQPARVTEIDETDEITEREVGILTMLSWWYEGESRKFASKAEISQRCEQADYGYNQSI